MCTNPQQLTAGSSPYLCVLPDGEFLTLGLLECIDRNPELTVSHTRRWALVKFLWGACCQRQRRSTFCHPLLSVLAACLPFFSLLLAAFALGTSLLQLQHSLDACLLLPRGSLASPGHTRPLVSRYCSTHRGGHELQTTCLTKNSHLEKGEEKFNQQELTVKMRIPSMHSTTEAEKSKVALNHQQGEVSALCSDWKDLPAPKNPPSDWKTEEPCCPWRGNRADLL